MGECGEAGKRGRMPLLEWVIFWEMRVGEVAASQMRVGLIPLVSDFCRCFQLEHEKKALQWFRQENRFDCRCCIMHTLLKQVVERLVSTQSPSYEGSSPASCIIYSRTPPSQKAATQTAFLCRITASISVHPRSSVPPKLRLHFNDLQTSLWSCEPIMWKESWGRHSSDWYPWLPTEVSLESRRPPLFHPSLSPSLSAAHSLLFAFMFVPAAASLPRAK